jgi:ABC-2 type transport system permease protein
MSVPISRTRVRAMVRKELREYRRTRSIVVAMAIIPLVFMVQPLVSVFAVSSAAAHDLADKHELLYMLGIPAIVPALLAAYSVVGERQQGTLEPVLTTPIRREELLMAKALAVLGPSVVISYLVYAVFLLTVVLFAHAGVADALIRGSDVAAQVIFTPLIATCSIWIATAISARSSDIRVAQQLSTLASLPSVVVTSLIATNVIHASLRLAVAFGIGLLIVARIGWRVSAAMFDRERLLTGSSATER